MPRFFKTKAESKISQKVGELSIKLNLESAELQDYLAEVDAELAAYKQDAERYIWLRDYSPQPNPSGEGRAEGYGEELDKLCDEGLEVLKAASDPTAEGDKIEGQDS